jgi:hypothetical protein
MYFDETLTREWRTTPAGKVFHLNVQMMMTEPDATAERFGTSRRDGSAHDYVAFLDVEGTHIFGQLVAVACLTMGCSGCVPAVRIREPPCH